MKSLIQVFVSAALVFGGSAYATDEESSSTEMQADRVELRKEHRAQRNELNAKHRAKRATQRMQMVDTNKDGKLDLAEYLQNAEQRFSEMDLDSDGYVTTDESGNWRKDMRFEHKQAMKAAHKANKQSAVDSAEE